MVEETQQATPENVWEPSMHSIWLVSDTRAFGTKGETCEQDHSVGWSLTYQEWLAIYFDALGLDKSGYEKWAAKKVVLGQHNVVSILTEFDEEITGFPMLSRIRGPFHDAVFELNELDALRNECLQVQSSTSNALALRGLEKLLLICDRAQKLRLSIYFVSN
jgi:hypothetical protein